MVNKNFIENPQYWLRTHREYSEAVRNAEYACGIYYFEEDRSNVTPSLAAVAFIAFIGGLMYYYNTAIAILR